MAIFHLSAAIVSRGNGQSAVAKAAYEAREKIKSLDDNTVKDYTKKGGLIDKGIILPDNAPDWMKDRAMLWNAVELKENESKRAADAQLARRFIYAIPCELVPKAQINLVKEIAKEFAKRGMVADYAIHEPDKNGDERNTHAHIMTTLRNIENGEFGKKNREWNSREYLKDLRSTVCDITNKYITQHNEIILKKETVKIDLVDHRSYEDRGIDKKPDVHLGAEITNQMRRIKKEMKELQSEKKIETSTTLKSENEKITVPTTEPLKLKPVKETPIIKKEPEPQKTKDDYFIEHIEKQFKNIFQYFKWENEDLKKRSEKIKKGEFDEHYKSEKIINNDSIKIINSFNGKLSTEEYRENLKRLYHALNNDPADYPKENKYNINYSKEYRNKKYQLMETIRQPFNKIAKEIDAKQLTEDLKNGIIKDREIKTGGIRK